MTTTIYIPDLACESCHRLVKKKLDANKIIGYELNDDHLILTADQVNPQQVITLITSLGFRASLTPFERKTVKERVRHARQKPHLYMVEKKGVLYFLFSLPVLFLVLFFARNALAQEIPLAWIIYLGLAIASIGIALWHYTAYRAKFTCMTGMMTGMTFGMQTGMMLGAVIGATNGFFTGAMVGMLAGVLVGALTGRCCGIMGIMEGMMAGVMGGTMGPMISVMMFSDNLLLFMPFYIAINMVIMAGLSYMLYEEVVEGNPSTAKEPLDMTTYLALCIVAATLLITIMAFAPKSLLFV